MTLYLGILGIVWTALGLDSYMDKEPIQTLICFNIANVFFVGSHIIDKMDKRK